MSLLYYNLRSGDELPEESITDARYERDALGDLKHGLDLIFEIKSKLDKLHPVACDTLIRLLSH